MELSEYFRILHIARRATWIIPKNRRKKATKNNILAIFLQRSVYVLRHWTHIMSNQFLNLQHPFLCSIFSSVVYFRKKDERLLSINFPLHCITQLPVGRQTCSVGSVYMNSNYSIYMTFCESVTNIYLLYSGVTIMEHLSKFSKFGRLGKIVINIRF
jgi:hypothetical protein